MWRRGAPAQDAAKDRGDACAHDMCPHLRAVADGDGGAPAPTEFVRVECSDPACPIDQMHLSCYEKLEPKIRALSGRSDKSDLGRSDASALRAMWGRK